MEKLRVRIVRDYSPQNPFLNWDCEPNIVWEFDRDIKGNLEQVKDAIYEAWDGEFKTEELSEILEVHKENFDDTEEFLDAIGYELQQYLSIKQLAQLCELFNIKHNHFVSRGYSQGDYAEVLAIIDDEYIQRTGVKIENSEEILNSTEKLFNAWAWGDVFGYILEERKRFTKIYEDGTTEEDYEWEQIDSCYGFYGDDWETNGIKEHLPKEVHDQLKYIEVEY